MKTYPAHTVRARRSAKGLSQLELAEKAGVGVATIKRLETGRSVTVPTLQRVAAALGVTAGALLDPIDRRRRQRRAS